jgi:HAD superfamily hydrolase (TIGR01509 family)
MFNEYGKDFDFNDYKQKVDGIPRLDGCRAILTDADQELINKACDKKQAYYIEYLEQDGVEVYETTVKLIKELIGKGINTAVVSSSKNCPTILEKAGLSSFFQVRISGDDITKGKPDPMIFLMAAERLRVEPKESIVFEDATLGVEGAKRANMLCVGIDRDDKPELFTKADMVVKDLGEVDFNSLNSLFPQ